jgi:hypothetical protein
MANCVSGLVKAIVSEPMSYQSPSIFPEMWLVKAYSKPVPATQPARVSLLEAA